MSTANLSLPLNANIAVIAPGYGGKANDIETAKAYITSLGFNAVIPDDLYGESLLHSNNDETRARHLVSAITSPDIDAIWCMRGGYGMARILPALEGLTPPDKPKLVIGFSDITALHLYVNQKWGWHSLHAPILWQAMHQKIDADSIAELEAILTGKSTECHYGLQAMNNAAKQAPALSAPVIGGNLSLLQNSVGTFWQANAKDKFLFIEDVEEKAYATDRMLVHLQQAGLLEGLAGLFIGDLSSFEHQDEEQQKIETVLQGWADGLPYPVFRAPGIGHEQVHHPLPLNVISTIADNTLGIGW